MDDDDKQMEYGGDLKGLYFKEKFFVGNKRKSDLLPSVKNKTEYGMLCSFPSERSTAKMFSLMSTALADSTWELLEIDTAAEVFSGVFKYLSISKRYRDLQSQSQELSYSADGFHLGEHIFETLDEVEKALKNKAFL